MRGLLLPSHHQPLLVLTSLSRGTDVAARVAARGRLLHLKQQTVGMLAKRLLMHGKCVPSARMRSRSRKQTAGAAIPSAKMLLPRAKKPPHPASQMVLLQLVLLLTAGVLVVDLGPLRILHRLLLRRPAGGRTEAACPEMHALCPASRLRFLQLLEFVCRAPDFVPIHGLF
ncbi:unnamed protein product [Triticum turgidum subsp. durum]|uniref:Uncharacterized protein n=2 Tax=Triticum turgidum subsp. durum TaxID=4567 RepID=A0A9R0Z3Y2_TRITD|nr:unnamed protein product [Triticum turgidum subsp. durum]